MYATSSALSRKLTGTSTRPKPLTPKYEMRKRAEFGLTMATRSPWADAHGVEGQRHAPGPVVHLGVGDGAERSRHARLVDHRHPVGAVHERGAFEEVADRERDVHGSLLRSPGVVGPGSRSDHPRCACRSLGGRALRSRW